MECCRKGLNAHTTPNRKPAPFIKDPETSFTAAVTWSLWLTLPRDTRFHEHPKQAISKSIHSKTLAMILETFDISNPASDTLFQIEPALGVSGAPRNETMELNELVEESIRDEVFCKLVANETGFLCSNAIAPLWQLINAQLADSEQAIWILEVGLRESFQAWLSTFFAATSLLSHSLALISHSLFHFSTVVKLDSC